MPSEAMKKLASLDIIWYNYSMVKPAAYISGSFLGFLLASISGFLFLIILSPEAAKIWQFALLYFLVFLSVTTGSFFLGYFFRHWFWRRGISFEFIRSARRQAVFFGFLAVIALLLQSARILNYQTGIPLLLIFLLFELYTQ